MAATALRTRTVGATRRRRSAALVAVATLATSACGMSVDAEESRSAATTTPPAAPATPTATASTTTPTTVEPRPITIALAGDIHFEAQLRARLDDPATALEPIAQQLSAADLTVVNLETSIGTSGRREPKRYTFQAPPQAFDALVAAGVDVATMANNHAMDFGASGLADTLAAISAASPLSVVGIGADADAAFAPALVDVGGTTVAVLGAHGANDPTADPTEQWAADDDSAGIAVARDPARLVEAVRTARDAAEVVVVYMHWGVQGDRCPSPSQTATARALSDAGADIVVGSHAHVVQGAGLLADTYVAYGLGNFVWYRQGSSGGSTTGVLTLMVEGGQVVGESWAPARIQSDGLPRFASGTEARRLAAAFADQRSCTDLAPVG